MSSPGDALSQLQAKEKEIVELREAFARVDSDRAFFNNDNERLEKEIAALKAENLKAARHPDWCVWQDEREEVITRAEKAEAELAEANTVQKATESNLGVQYDRLEDENLG